MTREEILKLNEFHTKSETDGVKELDPPQPVSRPHMPGYDMVLEDFTFKHGGKEYTIPAGFIFDGASIPRIAWRGIGHPFMQEFREAALVHDFGYDTAIFPRDVADAMLRDHLVANGVSKFKAGLMYAAVRTGGLFAWNRHRRLEKKAGFKTPHGKK